MANFLRGTSAREKLLTISVVGILLGIGLCGTGASLHSERVSGFFLGAGVSIFWLSALGMLVGVVWVVIKGLIEGGRPRR